MTQLTDQQKDKARSLVEYFRDAAFKQIENGRGGPAQEDVDAFVKYDTWLKLDAAEQAQKPARHQDSPDIEKLLGPRH